MFYIEAGQSHDLSSLSSPSREDLDLVQRPQMRLDMWQAGRNIWQLPMPQIVES